jgi:hypothetical protein
LTALSPKGEHRGMEILPHPDTPDEVDPKEPPREPESDPTLGLEVAPPAGAEPKHPLVTVGDSLTHGFQSGAIFNTGLSASWTASATPPTRATAGCRSTSSTCCAASRRPTAAAST